MRSGVVFSPHTLHVQNHAAWEHIPAPGAACCWVGSTNGAWHPDLPMFLYDWFKAVRI